MSSGDIITNTDSGNEMTPDRWRQVREIFDQAIERGREHQASLLDELCAADPVVRHEVEQLLLAHQETGRFVDGSASKLVKTAQQAAPPAQVGREIGPYLIVRELGHGGMGTVYLAERTVGRVRQQVALKIVRPSSENAAEVIRRFHREREILASLDHPNIARLRDLGDTGDGLPYLVMDYVDGERIDVYCDRKRLGIRDRLELFQTVCSAVQYAHSRGVIHRDLKPSNILVTEEGVVKLLDFGIAKLLDGDARPETLPTNTGLFRPMTIEYASPEQVKGEAVTTGSDIYSLAVVLYELLTGHKPFRVESRLLHEVARLIAEEPPIRPSVVVNDTETRFTAEGTTTTVTPHEVSALRGERPSRLQRRLKGDLDSILIKALRKERSWRYASAAELSEDIRRHLDGLPVKAHKDSFRYRAQKLVQRVVSPRTGVLHHNSIIFLGWGIFGVIALLRYHMVAIGWRKNPDLSSMTAVIGWVVLWSIREGRRIMISGRTTVHDRQATVVFGVIVGWLGLLSALAGLTDVLSHRALCVLWNAGLSMALLIMGFQASRVLIAGGITLLASVVGAAVDPPNFYLWLAAGVLFGVVGPGIRFAFENPPNLEIAPPKDQFITLNSSGALDR